MKTANAFTLTRILLAPIFFVVYNLPIWTGHFVGITAAVMIPFLAAIEITDYLDGHAARKRQEVSDFGKLFDPFADVIVHLTTFACFTASYSPSIGHYTPMAFYLLVIYREVTMNFLRMIAAKQGIAIAARKGGKLKTVFYVATGFVCLVPECAVRFSSVHHSSLGIVGSIITHLVMWRQATFIMFCISLLLCYISFIDYLIHFKETFKGAYGAHNE